MALLQRRTSVQPSERAKAALAIRTRYAKEREVNGEEAERIRSWRGWLEFIFPQYVTAPFSERHIKFWEWVESIELDNDVRPFIALWPRGGAKSTSAELAVVRIGSKKARRYVWYVSGTQEQADKHVENISTLLSEYRLSAHYPELGARALTKYGHSKGWRRNRLRTRSGLTVDALGLDTASRGAKTEERRPDLIILDDIDDSEDTPQATNKKINRITKDILPAGANNSAILFIQNLITADSIASRFVDGRADFLVNRILSGPYPAIEAIEFEQIRGKFVITGGRPTWEGQNLKICQKQVEKWGWTSFLAEAQHDVDKKGGKWAHIEFQHIRKHQLPELSHKAVWVDPAVTSKDESDCQGIIGGGSHVIPKTGKVDSIYVLYSWEGIDTPENCLVRAIEKAIEIGADHVGVETDQGGDTWKSVYKIAWQIIEAKYKKKGEIPPLMPKFVSDKAGAGYGVKDERNSKMMVWYENGMVFHVEGTHAILERALRRWPKSPLDLGDADFWLWNDLSEKGAYNKKVKAWGSATR